MSENGAVPIRVCVAGITGWTGRPSPRPSRAPTTSSSSPASRARRRARIAGAPVFASVAEALDAVPADVLVDYTSAEAVRANVDAAVERGVAVVVGSSGLTAEDFAAIDAAARAKGVGVIAAGNFSLLAALLLRSAAEIAGHVGSWEILDYASATKPDVPSGTSRELAERLGEIAQPRLGRPIDELQGPTEARGATVAGTQIHSLRLPSFVVSTEIVFAAAASAWSSRHDAGETPEPYVAGTLLAIREVGGRTGVTRGLDSLL